MGTRRSVAIIFAAILGGWLAVMPPAVVTIALRMREFDPSGLPTAYSLTLAGGWLAMIIALIGFGQLGDRIHSTRGSRLVIVRIALPVFVLASIGLALAPSPGLLATAWIVVQLPVAAIITTALAESGSIVPVGRRGILSGLIGASSIIALFVGSTLVNLLSTSLTSAFIVPALVGACLIAPLAVFPLPAAFPLPTATRHLADSSSATSTSSPERAGPPLMPLRPWVLFLAATLLLSWATSTTNGFIVLLVERIALIPAGSVASTATLLVVAATAFAIASSLAIGPLARSLASAATAWSIAAVTCCLALVGLLLWNTPTGLLVAAIVFGASFGIANGVEVSVILHLRHDSPALGRDMGVFMAASTVPYVLVPALASIILAGGLTSGLRIMFALAAALALVGAALTAVILRGSLLASARASRT